MNKERFIERGNKKWMAIMLPEHVEMLKEALIEEEKVNKPILDEHEIQEMELLILESMQNEHPLSYQLYDDGFTKNITGTIRFIDHINKKIQLTDDKEQLHTLLFTNLIGIQSI